MDIRAYIASGILEQYILGFTTSVETEEVERLARLHPEVQTEIEEIRSSLEAYAQQFAQTPPTALKDKIWETLEQADAPASHKRLAFDAPAANSVPADRKNELPVQVAPLSFWRTYGVAASFVLLSISLLLNLYLFNQLDQTKNRLLQATVQNAQLARQMEVNQANYSDLAGALRFYQDPNNQVIHLKGDGKAGDDGMIVFWNRKENQVYLSVRNLPPPPPGKQYQLWAIVDKKPVDAGVFTTQTLTVQSLKHIAQAQAFAVTLENVGGSLQPTGDILMVAEV